MTTDIQKYRVYLSGVVGTVVEVEVNLSELEDGEDAFDRAVDTAHQENRAGLCHQCARSMNPPEDWTPGSWTLDESYKAVTENVIPVD